MLGWLAMDGLRIATCRYLHSAVEYQSHHVPTSDSHSATVSWKPKAFDPLVNGPETV